MNFRKRNKSIVDILFLIALFAVFVISALLIIIFGARIYKNTVTNMENNFNHRTSLSYVTEKIRQYDYDGGIEVVDYDGVTTFKFNQKYNDSLFCTYLYEYEGYINELTVNSDYDFTPQGGQRIIAVNDFSVDHITDALYKCNIENVNGESTTFYVSAYSEKDGGEDIE